MTKRAKPDGISVTLMSEIAKRKGLEHVSKSRMFDLKKAYAAKKGQPQPGDESRIIEWAIAEDRSNGRVPLLPKGRKAEKKTPAVAQLLAAAVAVFRSMGIQSVSFFPNH